MKEIDYRKVALAMVDLFTNVMINNKHGETHRMEYKAAIECAIIMARMNKELDGEELYFYNVLEELEMIYVRE